MPFKDKQKAADYAKIAMRKKRGITGTGQGVTDPMLYPDGTKALLFTPSKFLSQEQDIKVQENVLNTMRMMSGSRFREFRGLGNVFTPNTLKDPSLEIP